MHLNEQCYQCWRKAIECGLHPLTRLRSITPLMHVNTRTRELQTHTCTYQGRSSTLHCLRICEWKNGLTHLAAERQDFLRFRTGGTDHLLVCLPALSVTLSISQSDCLSNTYLYRSLIACAKRLSQNLPARLSVWLFLAELARQFFFNLFCQAFCLCVLVYICLPVCLSVCLFQCVYLSVWLPARLTASVFEWLPICLPVSFLSSQSVCLTARLMFMSVCHFICLFSYSIYRAVFLEKKTKKLDTQLHPFNCLCLSLNSDCVGCKWCNRNLFFKA